MHELFNSPIIKQRNDNHLISLINVVAYKRYGQTWAGDLLTKFKNLNSKPILTAGRLFSFFIFSINATDQGRMSPRVFCFRKVYSFTI